MLVHLPSLRATLCLDNCMYQSIGNPLAVAARVNAFTGEIEGSTTPTPAAGSSASSSLP